MDLHSLDMDMVHDDPEDGRWDAFVRRDPGADGQFVVAVETTCIYCRPTCPARRPLRKNVRFLPDAATAERQGYRACKRCKPQLAQLPSEALVEKVKSLLLADLEAPPSLDALSRATALSAAHLQKTFKKHTGLSPKEFVSAARLERWKADSRREARHRGLAGRGIRIGRPRLRSRAEADGDEPRAVWQGRRRPAHHLGGPRHSAGSAPPGPDGEGPLPGGLRRGRLRARVDAPLGVPGSGARARLAGVGCPAPCGGGRSRRAVGRRADPARRARNQLPA